LFRTEFHILKRILKCKSKSADRKYYDKDEMESITKRVYPDRKGEGRLKKVFK
jgi:hypothetical protein